MPALCLRKVHTQGVCLSVPASQFLDLQWLHHTEVGLATSHMCCLQWKRMRWEDLTESVQVISEAADSVTPLRLFNCSLLNTALTGVLILSKWHCNIFGMLGVSLSVPVGLEGPDPLIARNIQGSWKKFRDRPQRWSKVQNGSVWRMTKPGIFRLERR